jgi:hypothetical protein
MVKMKWGPTHTVMLVFGAIALVLGIVYMMGGVQQQAITEVTSSTSASANSICENNLLIDGEFRVEDALSTSGAYLNGTVLYVKNKDTNIVKTVTVTGGVTGDFTSSSDIYQCTNTNGYEVRIRTTQDGFNKGVEVATVTHENILSGLPQVNLVGTKHSLITAQGFDISGVGASLYSAANLTTAQSMAATFYSAIGSTAFTKAAGECLEFEFKLKTASASEKAGQTAIIALNYKDETNTNDWDADTISLSYENLGVTSFTPNANDVNAMAGYEKFYALPYPVGVDAEGNSKSFNKLTFTICAPSDVNPDFDPVLRYVTLGDIASTDDRDVILEDYAFTDATSQTELGSATASTITISVD